MTASDGAGSRLSRFIEYASGRRIVADAALSVFGLGWLVLTGLGLLTVIVRFPGLGGTAANCVVLVVSLAACGFACSRALAPLYRGFGIEPRRKEVRLGPFSWSQTAHGPDAAPARSALAGPALWLLVMAVVVRLFMWTTHRGHHGALDAFMAELRTRGVPASLADFAEDPPDARYGESAFASALANLDPKRTFNSKKHPGEELKAWTPQTAEAEAPFVREFEPVVVKEFLPLAGRYSHYKKVDFRAASRNPLAMPIPKLAELIKLGSVFKLCAESHAFRKDYAKAWPYVKAELDVADMVASERSLISKMVTLALRRQAVSGVVVMLLGDPGLTIPKDLAKRLEALLGQYLARDGLRCELAFQLDFRDWIEGVSRPAQSVTGLDERFEYVLERLASAMGVVDLNVLEGARIATGGATAASWAQAREDSGAAEKLVALPAWPFFSLTLAVPRYSELHRKDWDFKTWLKLALAGSALAEYRKAHGRYPAELSVLSPAYAARGLLMDDFSDRPFAYSPRAGGLGFKLCSAGAKGDGLDAHGDTMCVAPGR
ncbi:MAG: hypothetical protein HY077_08420 [Elusimicrobia bacterium]|nr:hypothetical protein [Elusimicrobiota bacterium]